MSYWLDPTGRTTYGIGICDRCKRKFYIDQLQSDPNSPGLMVCEADRDDYDPYRLPARQSERINLPFVRPDVSVDEVNAPAVFTLANELWITEDGILVVTDGGVFIELEFE